MVNKKNPTDGISQTVKSDPGAPDQPRVKSKEQRDQIEINKRGFIETHGEVVDSMPGLKFKIKLETGHEIRATLAGRLRLHRIQIVVGDKVKIEMSPYDLTKGRIVYRL
jgi:translation initiation factor IF-1